MATTGYAGFKASDYEAGWTGRNATAEIASRRIPFRMTANSAIALRITSPICRIANRRSPLIAASRVRRLFRQKGDAARPIFIDAVRLR